MTTTRLTVEYRPLTTLQRAAANPKGHDDPAILASVRRLGMIDVAAAVDERTGRMYAGHGRLDVLTAARAAGHAPPRHVDLAPDGEWLVPVLRGWSSRTDAEAGAALVTHNQTTMAAGWHEPGLGELVRSIHADDQTLTPALGFTDDYLTELLADPGDSPGEQGGGAVEDVAAPDPETDPVTVLGDVWICGEHRVVCGDSLEVAATIDRATVALVLADPPYGVGERTDRRTKGRGSSATSTVTGPEKIRTNDFPPVAGDDRPFDPGPWLTWPAVILWGANHYADRLPGGPSWIVWDKLDGLTSTKRIVGIDDNADAELAWSNLGGPVRIIGHRWKGVVQASEKGPRRCHPTQKPVALMRRIVEWRTQPGDLILDPYAGSGPVLLAAQELGRRCLAVELAPRYCDVICRRWQALTGTLPVLESTGEAHDFTPSTP